MSDVIERAKVLRKKMEELANANLSEQEALEYPEFFSQWDEGMEYTAGSKVRYAGEIYKVLKDHTSQVDWNPQDATSLFSKVLVVTDESGEQVVIKEWEQPDSTSPYSKGDKVIFEGKIYESLIDVNVWSPSAYPAGWQEVAE